MHDVSHLYYILIILAAAILFVPLFERLRVSPILGYLAAGIVIGPFGLGLVEDEVTTRFVAEFGVVFLLFSIGLELPFQRLVSMRWYIFGLGFLQVFLTSLAIGFIAYSFGLSPEASLVIGGALALSSTAAVLQLLVEREEIAAKFGRITVAVLLFQDLAVVPLLVLIPLLAVPDVNIPTALGLAAVKGVGSIVAIVLIGRFIFRPLYAMMATIRNTEIFTATTLFIVITAAVVTAEGGMSMALGAFLSGMLLAETQYRHQIEADIHPFRGLFLGLFFMTIGMSVDIQIILDNLVWVFGVTFGLVVLKSFILTLIGSVSFLNLGTASRIGLTLAQGSEFGFVVLGLAAQMDVVPDDVGNILTISIALTLLLTPLLAAMGKKLSRGINHKKSFQPEHIATESDDLTDHVIIAGYGRMGKIVSKVLSNYRIPYVVLDDDISCVQDAAKQQFPVYFGDARRIDTLHAAGIERACAVIVALNNARDINHVVALVHKHYPDLEILVRSHDQNHKKNLESMGATTVIPEIVEPSLQLSAMILDRIGIPPEEIERTLAMYRKDNYAFLDSK